MNPELIEDFRRSPVQLNIMPVFKPNEIQTLMDIMCEEGYHLLEILARPMDDAIPLLRKIRPPENINIGIGTILTPDHAKRAAEAGADYIVSPAFSRQVLKVAVDVGLPYIPAVSTLQGIQDILDEFEAVGRFPHAIKVCPVDNVGLNGVRIMGEIYQGIMYCPTGTIKLETLGEWSALECSGPTMTSRFVSAKLIRSQDITAIRQKLQQIKKLAGM